MSSSPSPDRLLSPRDQAFSQNGRHPSARGPHAASHAARPVQASQHLLCLNHSSSSQAAPHPQLHQHSDPNPAPLTFGLALPREGFHPSILVLIRLGYLRARTGLKGGLHFSKTSLWATGRSVSSQPAQQHSISFDSPDTIIVLSQSAHLPITSSKHTRQGSEHYGGLEPGHKIGRYLGGPGACPWFLLTALPTTICTPSHPACQHHQLASTQPWRAGPSTLVGAVRVDRRIHCFFLALAHGGGFPGCATSGQ